MTTTPANFWIPGIHGTVYIFICISREDRNEMPTVAVAGLFVRKADAERFRDRLRANWRQPGVDLNDPEVWPSKPVHPDVWRAAVVWAVEQWLAPSHVRH